MGALKEGGYAAKRIKDPPAAGWREGRGGSLRAARLTMRPGLRDSAQRLPPPRDKAAAARPPSLPGVHGLCKPTKLPAERPGERRTHSPRGGEKRGLAAANPPEGAATARLTVPEDRGWLETHHGAGNGPRSSCRLRPANFRPFWAAWRLGRLGGPQSAGGGAGPEREGKDRAWRGRGGGARSLGRAETGRGQSLGEGGDGAWPELGRVELREGAGPEPLGAGPGPW